MAEDGEDNERKVEETKSPPQTPKKKDKTEDTSAREASGEDETDDDEDEEPRLKYVSLTKSQRSLYRNGDAVSAFLVGGDKMVSLILELNVPVLTLSLDNWYTQWQCSTSTERIPRKRD